MESVEKAVRSALEKGDGNDRKFRERVYLSALSALERYLEKKADQIPLANMEARRHSLRALIRSIETEYIIAVDPEVGEPLANNEQSKSKAQINRAAETTPSVEPTTSQSAILREGHSTEPRPIEHDFSADLIDKQDIRPEPIIPKSRRRYPFVWGLSAVVLVSFIAIGVWWVASSDFLTPLSERDGSVPNPRISLSEDEFEGGNTNSGGQVSPTSKGVWVSIFNPENPATAVAPSGTSVSVEGEGTAKYLHIIPSDTDSAVLFDIGQGILEQAAGKTVSFDIAARSSGDQRTQMSISCFLAELGDCGRKRYDVDGSRSNSLFSIELPDKTPGSSGSLSIIPDISKGVKSIDIYEIKVFIPK